MAYIESTTNPSAANGWNTPIDTSAPVMRYTTPPSITPAPISSDPAPTTDKPVLGAVDENAIREQMRKSAQAQVDAINANYLNLTNQETIAGRDRAGQTRAINARSGTMSSDFGVAQVQKTDEFNKQQIKSLQDEQQAKIAAVLANVEDRASTAIQNARTNALSKYNADFTAYKDAQDQARLDLKSLAEHSTDINTLSPAQKLALYKQAGFTDEHLGDLYYDSLKPKPEWHTEIKGNEVVSYRVNPATGKVDVNHTPLGFTVENKGSLHFAPDGTAIYVPDNIDPTKPLGDQIKTVGSFGKPETHTLGEGQVLVDDNGNVIAQGPDKPGKVVKINGVDYVDNGDGTYSTPNTPPVQANPQAQAQTKANIDLINGLLGKKDFANAVAPSAIGRWNIANPFTGAKSNVIASVEQLTSQLTLDSLIRAKAQGATFGALSEGELKTLAASASKIGSWAVKKDGQVVGYSTTEQEFRKELDKINNFAKMDYLLKGGKAEDIGATQMPDGTVWTKNNDGTMTLLLDGSSFKQAGNASASTQVKAMQQKAEPMKPITLNATPLQKLNLSYAPSIPDVNVKIGAGAAVKNNNPGNLRNTDGSWMKFASPQEGFRGLMGYLERAKSGNHTAYDGSYSLYQFFSKYAPAADSNNPKSYAESVAKALGVSPNTAIKGLDTFAWAKAIAKHESNTTIG